MKSIGIKYQLRVITLIPVFLVALLFALFYNMQYEKALKEHVSRLGHAFINQLVPAAQQAILDNNNRSLQQLIGDSSINPEIQSLAIYNAKGTLLVSRGNKHTLPNSLDPLSLKKNATESHDLPLYSINFIFKNMYF